MSAYKQPAYLDDYVNVNVRVSLFYEKFPQGRINTHYEIWDGFIIFRTEVFRNAEDQQPASTGTAMDKIDVNQSSTEKTETASCGRALALLGFEVKKSLASREEMEKHNRNQAYPQPVKSTSSSQPVIQRQIITPASIRELAKQKGIDIDAKLETQKRPPLDKLSESDLVKIHGWIVKAPALTATEPQQATQRDWYIEVEVIWRSLWNAKVRGFGSKAECLNHLITTALSYKWIDGANEIESHTDLSADQAEKYYSICVDLFEASKERTI